MATGPIALVASLGAGCYFTKKQGDLIHDSQEHVHVDKIKEESSRLKNDLVANCLENTSDEKSYVDCVGQAAGQYRSLELEKKMVMQSDNYTQTEKKIKTYRHYIIGSFFGTFSLPLIFWVAGVEITFRRKREEIGGEYL